MPQLGSISCITMNWPITPASRSAETFTHPTVPGLGVLYGPARQIPQRLMVTIAALDAAAAVALQAQLSDLANGAAISIDRVGDGLTDTNIDNCVITSPVRTSAKAVAGLPGENTWLVTAEMDAMPPLAWPS